MLVGHYTTAMIAHQKLPKGTFMYFLLASQWQDLLWFTLHYFGLESTQPSDVLDTTLNGLSVDMLFSHDLLPQVFWIGILFLIGKLLFKSTKIGAVGGALVAFHFVLDIFSGHAHHVFGAESADVAFGWYATNAYLAVAIEAIFVIITLGYYFKQEARMGIMRSLFNKASIIGMFVFGIGFMLSIATVSFRDWLGIPEFDVGFNTSVPVMIILYIAMIAHLNFYIPKYQLGIRR